MDALIMELSDQVKALNAEIRRIRAAAQHVLDKSHFNNLEELMDLDRALRSLQRELDQVEPSQLLFPKRSGQIRSKTGRRH